MRVRVKMMLALFLLTMLTLIFDLRLPEASGSVLRAR
jgi:hypothetical protein